MTTSAKCKTLGSLLWNLWPVEAVDMSVVRPGRQYFQVRSLPLFEEFGSSPGKICQYLRPKLRYYTWKYHFINLMSNSLTPSANSRMRSKNALCLRLYCSHSNDLIPSNRKRVNPCTISDYIRNVDISSVGCNNIQFWALHSIKRAHASRCKARRITYVVVDNLLWSYKGISRGFIPTGMHVHCTFMSLAMKPMYWGLEHSKVCSGSQ